MCRRLRTIQPTLQPSIRRSHPSTAKPQRSAWRASKIRRLPIAPIGCIAGSEYLSRDLTLELREDSDYVETAQLWDYLTVKRRGNTVTLRVQQTPQLEALLGVNNYDFADVDTSLFDKELEVNGLYGSYTKIVCGEIGESDEPFVFLLTVT